jgi:hypothetical protein
MYNNNGENREVESQVIEIPRKGVWRKKITGERYNEG